MVKNTFTFDGYEVEVHYDANGGARPYFALALLDGAVACVTGACETGYGAARSIEKLVVADKWVRLGDLLKPGTSFDTHHERGCVVVEAPAPGSLEFVARDSDGVECSFSVRMVLHVNAGGSK